MRTKTKTVYYCDYCNKHSLMPLTEHERHCTSNIHRICRLCREPRDYEKIVGELKSKYVIENIQEDKKLFRVVYEKIVWTGEPITETMVSDLVDGCPACMLTVIKHIDAKHMSIQFDYNEEVTNWWKEKNAVNDEIYY